VLPHVRDPDRMKNTAKSTRPISTTIPSVAVMTLPLEPPAWRWSMLKPFTEEGDPPRRIPFFLTATLVDRTS
jgi:hypothetical protein